MRSGASPGVVRQSRLSGARDRGITSGRPGFAVKAYEHAGAALTAAGAMVWDSMPHFYPAEACAERWLTASATAEAMETVLRTYKVDPRGCLYQEGGH